MAAVILAPHPEPRRPALRLVVSTPHEPGLARSRQVAQRRPHRAVYWRRRAMVLLVAVTLVALGWAVAGAMAGPADDLSVVTAGSGAAVLAPATAPEAAPAASAAPKVYVVRPGDTVWSIAERLAPEGDVRELVDELTERAGGSGLQAGQRIALDGLAV
jgi:hypothetical protein